MPRRVQWTIGAAVGALALGLAAFNLVLGDLNQDEGWYLYAARLVAGGAAPYRDFAFTQGPLLPLVYGLLHPLWGPFGVAGGRVLTACFGLLAALAAAALAARLVPNPERKTAAAVSAFSLIALNMTQSYFHAVVKTYALGGFLLAMGFLFLVRIADRRGPALSACAAAACLAAAAAARLSAAVALPAALLFLWQARKGPAGRAWLWFLAAGLAAGALLFGPFAWMAPDGLRFALLEYHAGRAAGGWGKALVLKAGFVSRVAQAYYPALLLGLGTLAATAFRKPEPAVEPRDPVRRALWVTLLAMTLVHLATPFPYDDYQVPLYPLLAASVAAWAFRRAGPGSASDRLQLAIGVGALLFALASPLHQEWVVQERDRVWWRMKERPPLKGLQEAAAAVRRLAPEGGELLTQDPYLAVEAGMTLPRGLELGPFSYFPEMPDARADRLRVVNRSRLRAILSASPARVAAFSGYGLAIRAPEVEELPPDEQAALWTLVRERFEPAGVIPRFGQAGTTLTLWIAKPPPPAGGPPAP